MAPAATTAASSMRREQSMAIDVNRYWAKSQFTANARLRLYRKMAKMLSNGLPLLKILEELYKRETDHGKKPNEPVGFVLNECRRMVQNGRSLAEGLEWWVPRSEQMIIAAGEQSGRLEATLIAVVDVVVAGRKIKNVVMGGVVYPVTILSLVAVYIYMFGTKVIPEFTRMVDPTGWRGAAKSLYLMSIWVQTWMLPSVLAVVAFITLVLMSMPRWRGNIRIFFDRYAPFSIYRLIIGSGFLMSFSALQAAGVTVEKSLVRLSSMSDPWLQERLDGALLGVRSGLNCGEALRNAGYGFPSKEVIDDLCVYAEYKGFSQALKMLADEWMEDGVEAISVRVKILNGVSIVILAVVIAWLVSGFFGIQQEIASMAKGR
jgi:type II secretory pathway component PulF